MAKRSSKTIVDSRQEELFTGSGAGIAQTVPGNLDCSLAVRELLTDVLADTKANGGKDRYSVSADMSRRMGRDASKNSLDRMTAPSAEEWRFPLEYLPALVAATGDLRLLDYIAERCGCVVLRREDALVAEYGAAHLRRERANGILKKLRKAVPEGRLDEVAEKVVRQLKGSGNS